MRAPLLLLIVLVGACVPPTSVSETPARATSGSEVPGDAVLYAAGDIASCGSDGDEATAALVDNLVAENPGALLALGDLAYENGTAREFARCYDPTWGQFKGLTIPTPGNHEYGTPEAAGYFRYFGAPGLPGEGWHARAFDNWTVVALNSNCSEVGGCGPGSAQAEWFSHFLSKFSGPGTCVVAIWHHPRWSSGVEHGSYAGVADLWRQAYDGGVDLVLTGHEHQYERFVPMNADGTADPTGMVEFVVGTGGRSLYDFGDILPTSAAHDNSTYGVLKLTLRANGYDWEFVPVASSDTAFADAGSADCR